MLGAIWAASGVSWLPSVGVHAAGHLFTAGCCCTAGMHTRFEDAHDRFVQELLHWWLLPFACMLDKQVQGQPPCVGATLDALTTRSPPFLVVDGLENINQAMKTTIHTPCTHRL